ncbi:MAG: hypothetical protein WC096_09730 [Sphaerochaetaceae bacterium]
MKKHILPLLLLGIVFLFVACDGAILSDVVNSTESVSKKYQNIIGIDGSKVYYQLSTGIYSNVSGGGSETQIVANSEDHLVNGSALVTIDGAKYIMYSTSASSEQQNGTLHFYSLDDFKNETATIEQPETVTKRELTHLYSNGVVLVKDLDNSAITYRIYYGLSGYTNNGTATFSKEYEITISSSTDTNTDLNRLYFQTAEQVPTKAILSLATYSTATSGDDDYSWKQYLVDFSSTEKTISNDITGDLSGYEIAGVTIADTSNIYAITTGGKLYKSSSGSTFVSCEQSLGYSYTSDAFMYPVTGSSKNYLITKSSTKNSVLIIYTFDKGTFSSSTVRYGYARLISKDLINAAFEISTNKLLVATNESGMVSISIPDDPTGNSSGSSSDFEEYEFPEVL